MPKRILVIDDEEGIREAFVEALSTEGYQVVTAASGEEGLQKAREAKPNLIFLDLKMPGMDGVETLLRLQETSALVPVYIVTAFRAEFGLRLKEASRRGLRFEVLDKPLDGRQIRACAHGRLEGPQAFADALPEQEPETKRYLLRIFTIEKGDEGKRLADAFKKTLSGHYPDGGIVELVDVIDQPEKAVADQVFATPAIVKEFPEPVRRVIGDLRDTSKILVLLGLIASEVRPPG